jgi:protein-tyrosine phosphatase
MLDLHFHCLPGIDDGPSDWNESVALCRAAADEGTATVVATPHVLRDPWINADRAERERLVAELDRRLGGRPRVLPGCEYLYSSHGLELFERAARGEGPLSGIDGGGYVLVELPPAVPASIESDFYEISLLGLVPVIAHPERHPLFARDPSRLERLVARGALVQLTAGSLLGDFGPGAERASAEFIRSGLAHAVASDAHSLDRRPPRLAEARRLVRRRYGDAAAAALFEANPRAIARSERLGSASPPPFRASSSRP